MDHPVYTDFYFQVIITLLGIFLSPTFQNLNTKKNSVTVTTRKSTLSPFFRPISTRRVRRSHLEATTHILRDQSRRTWRCIDPRRIASPFCNVSSPCCCCPFLSQSFFLFFFKLVAVRNSISVDSSCQRYTAQHFLFATLLFAQSHHCVVSSSSPRWREAAEFNRRIEELLSFTGEKEMRMAFYLRKYRKYRTQSRKIKIHTLSFL